MEINLSQFAGFCNGVRRAYDMVMSLDLEKAKKPVYVLGSLVHNPDVIRRIEEKGIGKIDRQEFFSAKAGDIGTLIITAHGTGPDIFEAARAKKIDIIDTTCPKVIKVQRLARTFARRGSKIVLVGDRGHKEVKGISEWGEGRAQVVSEEADLEKLDLLPGDQVAVISQTTQSENFFDRVAGYVREKFPKSDIVPTICNSTHERQSEIKKMAVQAEAVIVIGSKISANSTRLYEIARSLREKTFFIENASELELDKLDGIKKVAVTAGASTPEWIIKEVIKTLENHPK